MNLYEKLFSEMIQEAINIEANSSGSEKKKNDVLENELTQVFLGDHLIDSNTVSDFNIKASSPAKFVLSYIHVNAENQQLTEILRFMINFAKSREKLNFSEFWELASVYLPETTSSDKDVDFNKLINQQQATMVACLKSEEINELAKSKENIDWLHK